MDLEHERRLTQVEQRSKSNTHRLEKLEASTEAINRLATSMEVMVNGYIGGFKHGCKLVLCGCCLVMLGFCGDAKAPKLHIKIVHILAYAGGESSEIMIVKLLTLNCRCTEESSAAIEYIAPCLKILIADKEVFLLCAYGCSNAL